MSSKPRKDADETLATQAAQRDRADLLTQGAGAEFGLEATRATQVPDVVAAVTQAVSGFGLDATRGIQVDPQATVVTAQDGSGTVPTVLGEFTPAEAATQITPTSGSPATVATARPETRPFTSRDTGITQDAIGSGSYPLTGGATDPGTGVLSRDGRSITLRTRANRGLPPDVQQLDQSLQLSRRSVFVHLVDGKAQVPDLVKRRLSAQDTVGRYVVNKPLAAGGMGAVLDISDHDFQRRAAMKVMHARSAHRPEALERFLEEAQITAQLEHPNIVPIHDLGVTGDGTLFYTMKLIQGESLGQVVKKLQAKDAEAQARWTEEVILLTFLKVLDGLGYAHERGVIHRDIKPDNIMVEQHGEVLVVDWGIAKVLGQEHAQVDDSKVRALRDQLASSATLDGSVMGTPHYMPPEQADGRLQELDGRSDIYALGVTLYELLSLQRPFPKVNDLRELIGLVLSAKTVPLEQVAPHLHQDLVAIVRKAMAFGRDDRYADCSAFAADLRAYLAGQAVAARKRNWIERAGAWIGRNKKQVIAAAAALVLVVAAGGIGIAWTQAERQRQGAGLLVDARTAWDQLDRAAPVEKRLRDLAGARRAVDQAAALLPADAAVAALREDMTAAFGAWDDERRKAEERAIADAAAITANVQSRERWKLGKDLRQAGKLDEAAAEITAALTLAQHPSLRESLIREQTELEALRAAVAADRNRQQVLQLAGQVHGVAAAAASALDGLPIPDDKLIAESAKSAQVVAALKAVDDTMQQATGFLAQARSLQVPVPELDAAAEALAVQRTRAQHLQGQLRSWQERQTQSLAMSGLAAEQLPGAQGDEGKLGEIRAAALRANSLFPANPESLAVLANVDIQLATITRDRDARAARAERERRAGESLQQARDGVAELERLRQDRTELTARIAQLGKDLKNAVGDQRQPLWLAHDQLAANRRRDAERWPEVEGQALEAWNLLLVESPLADTPEHSTATAARQLLADLNMQRYREALAAHDLAGAAAYAGKVRRYDREQRYGILLSGEATLSVTGTGDLRVQRLERLLGRFQPAGEVSVHALPVKDLVLPSGRWRLEGAGQRLDCELESGAAHNFRLPGPAPALRLPSGDAIDLAWLPSEDGQGGAWLSRTEITHAQYAEFIRDPAHLAALRRALDGMIERGGMSDFPLLPRVSRAGLIKGRNWPKEDVLVDGERAQLRGYHLPEHCASWPVSGITRADAEAFCSWLGKHNKCQVRLPTLPEWQRAAHAGEAGRIHPWGELYDPSFTDGHVAGRQEPAAVASIGADVGPYGHRDLAGSVREWVNGGEGDRLGSYDALVAGGSWTDALPQQFAARATEAIPASAAMEQIGFRILTEAP